jgi:cellulose synthase (UDP-forming)
MLILDIIYFLSIIILLFLNLQFLISIFFRKAKHIKTNRNILIDSPFVTILIPCCDENKSVLERSLRSCHNIDYTNYKVVLIENSTSTKIKKSNIELANSYKIEVLSTENMGSKASALNYAINRMQSDYFVIMDADQEALPSILYVLVSEILNSDKEIVCIQSAQSYKSREKANFWSATSIFTNKIFFEIICNLYAKIKTSPCLGTNFIIRGSVIQAIGGFPDYSLTEDIALTFLLYRNNFRIKFLNIDLGIGIPVSSFYSYMIQQFRWAKGTFQVFKKEIVNLIYFPSLLFLILSFFLYYMLGCSIVFFSFYNNIAFVNINHFIVLTSIIVLLYIAFSSKDGYKVIFLIIITFLQTPIHFWGIFSGLINYRGNFKVTPKEV